MKGRTAIPPVLFLKFGRKPLERLQAMAATLRPDTGIAPAATTY